MNIFREICAFISNCITFALTLTRTHYTTQLNVLHKMLIHLDKYAHFDDAKGAIESYVYVVNLANKVYSKTTQVIRLALKILLYTLLFPIGLFALPVAFVYVTILLNKHLKQIRFLKSHIEYCSIKELNQIANSLKPIIDIATDEMMNKLDSPPKSLRLFSIIIKAFLAEHKELYELANTTKEIKYQELDEALNNGLPDHLKLVS